MLFLSIHPRFVDKILLGEKTLELRRQRPRCVSGDWIAVYSTTPDCQLRGFVQVAEVRVERVRDMWTYARRHACLTQVEYESYFNGRDRAVGLVLEAPISLKTPVSLNELRIAWPGFHPPQGFRYLSDEQEQLVKSFPRISETAAA